MIFTDFNTFDFKKSRKILYEELKKYFVQIHHFIIKNNSIYIDTSINGWGYSGSAKIDGKKLKIGYTNTVNFDLKSYSFYGRIIESNKNQGYYFKIRKM